MATTTVLLCGVGGQGTVLAADVLAQVALKSGCDVKLSEIHGMAQRGGAVSTVVRFGDSVSSMRADKGSCQFVVAFETIEALRNLEYLCYGGTLLVNNESIKPLPVAIGQASMPRNGREILQHSGAHFVSASYIARQVKSPKSANIVLLGALAYYLEFDLSVWEEVISKRVPRHTIEGNLAAFREGQTAVSKK